MTVRAALLALLVLIAGCTTTPGTATLEPDECRIPYEMADPWESFNRTVYRFNAQFDEAIFLPVVFAYAGIVPQPVRTGINNFFRNLGELRNTVNHTLQGQLGGGLQSAARFAVNTTLGIGGLFDPATRLGLERRPNDFGLTLARWGTASGPYLVLPLTGPSSVRDGAGLAFDAGLAYTVDLGGLYQADYSWMLATLGAIDTRAQVPFRYYGSGSVFEYEMVRFLYSNMRMIEAGIELPDFEECQ